MGEAKLVAPSDELTFSTSSQWQESNAPVLSQAKVASTCPEREPLRPFNEPLAETALTELSHKNFAVETLKKVR